MYEDFLESAILAARAAEKVVMNYFGREKGISYKGKVDLVTKADIESEQTIVKFLNEKYPDHGFILEEGDDVEGKEFTWIIDPIDGTTSFAHNYPFFSIAIALHHKNKPVLGVVLAPYLKELFTAIKGQGAFLNAEKIQVSDIETLDKSLITTGFPYERVEGGFTNLENFEKIAKIAQGLRRDGSAALDVCYVAAGRIEGYWEFRLKKVDTAASQIILKEAGGMITDVSGNEITDDYDTIVASNGRVHKELLSLLKKPSKK